MVVTHSIFLFLALAQHTLASNGRSCTDFTVSVDVHANNTVYDIPRVDSNIDAVDFIRNIAVWSAPNSTSRIRAPRPVNQKFNISACLCVPLRGTKAGILHVATHGFGFDKRYWDPERRAGTNSYVNAALEAGYSILIYDRLGVGLSDKPDAYEILQAPVEVEVLHQLTSLARSGQLCSPSQVHQGAKVPKFDKIILVGHSFGTAITSGVVSKYGDTIDGAVLTAFVINREFSATGVDSFGLEYAPQNDRKRFGSFSSGTLVEGTISNIQQIFMKKGAFELDMLDYAEEVKQPGAVGEFLSIGTVWPLPAPAFTGPVLIALAEFDFPICGGNCVGVTDLAALGPALWPNASDISEQIHPHAGHGLTLHRNATGHFQAIFSYLNKNGL